MPECSSGENNIICIHSCCCTMEVNDEKTHEKHMFIFCLVVLVLQSLKTLV